jgi:hypothetical protein
LSSGTSVSFSTYQRIEKQLLERLVNGEAPDDVLGPVEAVLGRDRTTWRAAAMGFRELAKHPTRVGAALAWLALGILGSMGEESDASPRRPWTDAYDLAEARSSPPSQPDIIIGDFLADQLWNLAWVPQGGFDRAKAFVRAQAAIASAIAKRLVRDGARPDRAAAEAVMVVEVGSGTDGMRLAFEAAWSSRAARGHTRRAAHGADPRGERPE